MAVLTLIRKNLLKESQRFHTIAVVCGIIFGACGGLPKLKKGSEPADYRRPIYKIVIEGNKVFSDDEIASGLINSGSTGWWFWRDYKRFDPAELSKDSGRIRGLYRQHGYFSTKVVSVKEERLVGGAVRIVFVIEEGEPSKIVDVSVEFADDPSGRFADSTQALRKEVSQEMLMRSCCRNHTRTGDVFDHDKYVIAKARLKRFMLNRGFAHASIVGHAEVNRETNKTRIRFKIDSGPKVLFSKTQVEGLNKLPESVIKNRIAWNEGELFSQNDLDETKGSLLRLGRFTTVEMRLGDGGRSDLGLIRIKVAEQRLREIRLGGGAAFDAVQWELRTRAEYTRSNFFFDPLSSLKVRLKPAYRWLRTDENSSGFAGEGELAIERTDFLFPLITGTGAVAYSVERFESYTVAGPSLRLSVRRPIIDERLIAGFAWNLSRLNFPTVNDALSSNDTLSDELGLSGNYRLGAFEESLALDFRDNAISPRLGVYVSGGFEHGASYAGGAFDYASVELDVRTYLPLTQRLVAAARARYSRLLLGDTLPLTRRYFAGGSSSHRGFPQRRISPTVNGLAEDGSTTTAFIGGDVRLESSFELRLDILPVLDDWFGVVGFVDAGDVANRKDDLVFGELHIATGIGLRIGTPIGPIRADFGVRMNHFGDDAGINSGRWAFHLGIGEAF